MPVGEHEIEAHISGHVQGVTFRAFIQKHARELGVTGWVRNTADGDVEVVAQGERSDLEQLAKVLRRGPYFARVAECDIDWHETPQDTCTEFTIEPTA